MIGAPLSANPGVSNEPPMRAAATKDKIRKILNRRIEVSFFGVNDVAVANSEIPRAS
jgi:hypothetical protein